MEYIIKSKRQVDDTLFTTVEYNFDETKVLLEVAHFQPQSKEEIITGIENRGLSEERKFIATQKISELINKI